MADLAVSRIILEQLGGHRFTTMTGAKNFLGDDNSLLFSIGMANGINKVRVTLTPFDLYDMEFFRVRGSSVKLVHRYVGVYADQLPRLFEEQTGLATRM